MYFDYVSSSFFFWWGDLNPFFKQFSRWGVPCREVVPELALGPLFVVLNNGVFRLFYEFRFSYDIKCSLGRAGLFSLSLGIVPFTIHIM